MRTQNIFFIIFGLLAACFSALGLIGASVPVEDASAAMLEHQSMSINLWWFAILGSFVLVGVGIRGLWKSRR
ncbi:hypothetical protein [Marinobacter sp. CHS3-4]|uniref:hypothetical protein n=1 Tax=Marinobacter sp. CHS3-4 TaxID=3045174 RepID=UPI0024B5497D|nr:hypothetical protein [Marinobacter sp. CHS3-4]MDI9244252.1 hypothetical protein [Marinobacter sp. CHS3-4]